MGTRTPATHSIGVEPVRRSLPPGCCPLSGPHEAVIEERLVQVKVTSFIKDHDPFLGHLDKHILIDPRLKAVMTLFARHILVEEIIPACTALQHPRESRSRSLGSTRVVAPCRSATVAAPELLGPAAPSSHLSDCSCSSMAFRRDIPFVQHICFDPAVDSRKER